VRHVGTQYEVRTHADDMVVSVREGRVMIANAAEDAESKDSGT
jgi:ferric-dicitrate binding protein FerR (iron transport regulator)